MHKSLVKEEGEEKQNKKKQQENGKTNQVRKQSIEGGKAMGEKKAHDHDIGNAACVHWPQHEASHVVHFYLFLFF